MLYAEGSAGGKTLTVYSSGVDEGCINITPITDFIVRNAVGGDPGPAFDDWNISQLSEQELDDAKALVRSQLEPLLSGLGISQAVDLITTAFEADLTGMDQALEILEFEVDGDSITVTNTVTGSSFTADVTANDSEGLPLSDATEVAQALIDTQAINQIMDLLEDVFSVSQPDDLSDFAAFAPFVADDYLEEGFTKTEMLESWLEEDDGLGIGTILTAVVVEALDMGATEYEKGYRIMIHYVGPEESGYHPTTMVYDGETWLWWGDRAWLETGVQTNGFMSVTGGATSLQTGLDLYLEDDNDYAWNQGVRSAIITGPGLPASGLVYQHMYPSDNFNRYEPWGTYGSFYPIESDAILSEIDDNAEYTFVLCEEEAAELYEGSATCTALYEKVETSGKAPVLNADLTEDYFVSLNSPTHHNVALLNFGGPITFSWTNPPGFEADEALLVWSSGESYYHLSDDLERNATSITLDTTDLPGHDGWAGVFISVEDVYGRWFNMGWSFY